MSYPLENQFTNMCLRDKPSSIILPDQLPPMDFSAPPPTYMYWPQQVNPYATPTHNPFPIPQQQAIATTSTAARYNDASTFNSIKYSTLQPISYRNRRNPRNSTVSKNAPGHSRIPPSYTKQKWSTFCQRSRFKPINHNYRPGCSNQNQPLKNNQKTYKSWSQKPWNLEDAVKAISVEKEIVELKTCKLIKITFPDHELNTQVVRGLHADIGSVYFPNSSKQRSCFVEVRPNVSMESVANRLKDVLFQHENLRTEIKEFIYKEPFPESIDPFSLYLKNLPVFITPDAIRIVFPKINQVRIQQSEPHRKTAIIRFNNVEDAIEAIKKKKKLFIGNHLVPIRFKRVNHQDKHQLLNKLTNESNELEAHNIHQQNEEKPIQASIANDEYDSINSLQKIKEGPVEISITDYEYNPINATFEDQDTSWNFQQKIKKEPKEENIAENEHDSINLSSNCWLDKKDGKRKENEQLVNDNEFKPKMLKNYKYLPFNFNYPLVT